MQKSTMAHKMPCPYDSPSATAANRDSTRQTPLARALQSLLFVLLCAIGSLLLAACTEESRPPEPTPTPTAAPPSPTPNAIDLGISNIASLGKYRYTLDVSATGVTVDAQLRGEYFTPNLGIISGTIGGVSIEQLVAGQRIYVRNDDGNWARI